MNYITRERVHADRIATAWANRKFIDSGEVVKEETLGHAGCCADLGDASSREAIAQHQLSRRLQQACAHNRVLDGVPGHFLYQPVGLLSGERAARKRNRAEAQATNLKESCPTS